jgi:IS30 family transposase
MATGYQQLTVDDRNLIQRGLNTGMSCRQIRSAWVVVRAR